jgi:hypothetical protein
MVGHLPHKQRREGVCDNQRDLHMSFLHVFFINQCNAQSLTIGFSSDYSAARYQLCGEVEQVFQNESGCLDGHKWIWFAAPVALQIGVLP